MFENLRRAFREAVDNFERELNRDDVGGAVDRLLAAMRQEVTDTQAQVRALEDERRRALREAEAEAEEVATCRRRATMAREIGDDETAGIAERYGEKHARREAVLRQKATALGEELELRRGEVQEMLARLKEAAADRAGLTAAAGRASARQSLGQAEDLFDELDRMAGDIEDRDRRRDAAEEVLDDLRIDLDEPPRPAPDLDARLAELKRRMGRED